MLSNTASSTEHRNETRIETSIKRINRVYINSEFAVAVQRWAGMLLVMPASLDYRGFSAMPPIIKKNDKEWRGELQNIHTEREMIECGYSVERPQIFNAYLASVPDS